MNILILLTAFAALCPGSVLAESDLVMERIDSSFSDLDDDNDGFITEEEAEGESLWVYAADMDTDGDGKLSTAEFDQFVHDHPELVEDGADVMLSGSRQEAQLVKGLKQEFAILDKDNNSYITMEEAEGSDVGVHFSQIDLDGDDKIHEMEYVEYASRHGTKLYKDPLGE